MMYDELEVDFMQEIISFIGEKLYDELIKKFKTNHIYITDRDELKSVKKKIWKQSKNEDLFDRDYYEVSGVKYGFTNIGKIYCAEYHNFEIRGGEVCEDASVEYWIPYKNEVINIYIEAIK